MDPSDPQSFNHRTETLSTGRTYHFVDQKPEGYDSKRHPTLVLVHGFPDIWYGWRFQIGPWVRRGSRVIAPDMLGYGRSSKPVDAQEYSTKKLCADLAALLDLLGIKRAVFIGHDWGAFTVGRFALWHPNRILALVMLSVPFSPPSREYLPLEKVVERVPNFGYQLYFSSSKANLEVLAHLRKFLRIVYSPPTSSTKFHRLGSLENMLLREPDRMRKTLLTETEFEYYYSEFKKGIFGPLNYYRTSKFRHNEELAYNLSSNLRPDLPFLLIYGTQDLTAVPAVINNSKKFITKYQDVALEGRGHWVMIEAKDEITQIVGNWLEGLTSSQPNAMSQQRESVSSKL